METNDPKEAAQELIRELVDANARKNKDESARLLRSELAAKTLKLIDPAKMQPKAKK